MIATFDLAPTDVQIKKDRGDELHKFLSPFYRHGLSFT